MTFGVVVIRCYIDAKHQRLPLLGVFLKTLAAVFCYGGAINWQLLKNRDEQEHV